MPRANYKDPRWIEVRDRIRERDNHTCVHCGATGEGVTLDVHHMNYEGEEIWDTPDERLQLLCRSCHFGLGRHPQGGIYSEGDHAFGWNQCPKCGGTDLKDKGSFDKCLDCGHRITAGWE